jgi:hypothetical protein
MNTARKLLDPMFPIKVDKVNVKLHEKGVDRLARNNP